MRWRASPVDGETGGWATDTGLFFGVAGVAPVPRPLFASGISPVRAPQVRGSRHEEKRQETAANPKQDTAVLLLPCHGPCGSGSASVSGTLGGWRCGFICSVCSYSALDREVSRLTRVGLQDAAAGCSRAALDRTLCCG